MLAVFTHADIAMDKAKTLVPAIKEIIHNTIVINAIKDQNERYEYITFREILNLDKKWRNAVKSGQADFFNTVTSEDLSFYLKNIKNQSNGAYTEIIIMDNNGLNVGQSDITSDYWQGDEDKWNLTYLVGPDAVHIGKIILDDSSKSFQSQINLPIVDPYTKEVIGAATVGVFVNTLLK